MRGRTGRCIPIRRGGATCWLSAAAIATRGHPSSLRRSGAWLARKKGRKRALVAVARKLAVVLHAMWTDGTMFCSAEKEVLA